MLLEVANLKAFREFLCRISVDMENNYVAGYNEWDKQQVEKLIEQIDVFRPLGPNGKHGNRHTPFCGCEDIPQSPVPTVTMEVFFDRAKASVMEEERGRETDV